MSSDKLILSFPDKNMAFSIEQLKAAGGIIQFMDGFEGSFVLSHGLHKMKVRDEDTRGKNAAIQIYEVASPPSSIEGELADLHVEPVLTESIPDLEETNWKPTGWGTAPSTLASSSSVELPLTRSQKRNKKARLKGKEAKEKAKSTEELYPRFPYQMEGGGARLSPWSAPMALLQKIEGQRKLADRQYLEQQRKAFQEWEDCIRRISG